MSAHIIGRPNDDLLGIILGHGADPEQAFIRGSEQGREEGEAGRNPMEPVRPPIVAKPAPDSRRREQRAT